MRPGSPRRAEADEGRDAGAPRVAVAAHAPGDAADLAATRAALHAANERVRQLARRLDETHQAHEIFMEVSREMLLARSAHEVVELFAGALRRLLPGRHFGLRVVEPRTLEPLAERYEGPSAPRTPELLRFKTVALRRMGLPDELASHPRVVLADAYAPLFDGTSHGLAMPLCAGGALHGLLNVEYEPGAIARREEDGLLLRPLVNQTSVVLHKLALASETQVLKEYLEKIVDHANAIIVMLDRDQRVRVINRELERLSGHARDEVTGRAFADLLPVEERQRLLRVLIDSLRGEATRGFETRIRCQDGGELRVVLNAAPILGAGGEVESVVLVGQDQTKVRDLERQVLHAEKLATLGQLAAGVVHELNTPLTSITVWADFLLRKLGAEGRDPADLEKLGRIQDGAERIRSFTRDLTVYARPAGSDLALVAINEVVRQAVSFCEHVADAKRASMRVALAPEGPRVFGVAGQLQQVLLNLLTNACDAIDEAGGGLVDVETLQEGDVVRIVVRDEGAGVRELDRERIFEPFFSTKPPGKGTGLGLSIVRDIVESHGGRVVVEAAEPRGAAFVVTLPVGRRPEGGAR